MRAAVIGAGAWGTTLAALLAPRVPTRLWAREPEVAASIGRTRENAMFLAGCLLPPELVASNALPEVVEGAEVVVVAVPAQHVRATMAAARAAIAPTATVVTATKGIESGTRLRMSQVLHEVLEGHDPGAIGVLTGPNLAREVFAGHPSATCVAFTRGAPAEAVQRLLMGRSLRVYTSGDVIGCEIGGAAKNVIAIAAGVSDGLGFGVNTKAALVTRGLAEITRLGVALGADALTFLGLAGTGDLVATCVSDASRNRRVGEGLGRGRALEAVCASSPAVAEGVATTRPLLELAASVGVEMPIAGTVDALLRAEVGAADVADRLLLRVPQSELHGIG